MSALCVSDTAPRSNSPLNCAEIQCTCSRAETRDVMRPGLTSSRTLMVIESFRWRESVLTPGAHARSGAWEADPRGKGGGTCPRVWVACPPALDPPLDSISLIFRTACDCLELSCRRNLRPRDRHVIRVCVCVYIYVRVYVRVYVCVCVAARQPVVLSDWRGHDSSRQPNIFLNTWFAYSHTDIEVCVCVCVCVCGGTATSRLVRLARPRFQLSGEPDSLCGGEAS